MHQNQLECKKCLGFKKRFKICLFFVVFCCLFSCSIANATDISEVSTSNKMAYFDKQNGTPDYIELCAFAVQNEIDIEAKYKPLKQLVFIDNASEKMHENNSLIRVAPFEKNEMDIVSDKGIILSVSNNQIHMDIQKEEKSASFSLHFTTAYCEHVHVQFSLIMPQNTTNRLTVLVGENEQVVYSAPLKGGKNNITFYLPSAYSDLLDVKMQFVFDQFTESEAMIFEELKIEGIQNAVSLAKLKQHAKMAEKEYNIHLTIPTMADIDQLTDEEIEAYIQDLDNQISDILIKKSIGTVQQFLPNQKELKKVQHLTAVCQDEKNGAFFSTIHVPLDPNVYGDKVYVVRYIDGKVVENKEMVSYEHAICLPVKEGVYVILNCPYDALIDSLEVKEEPLSKALIDSAFKGVAPSSYLIFEYQKNVDIQKNVVLDLENKNVTSYIVWLYKIENNKLSLVGNFENVDTRVFTFPSLTEGTYLMLDKSLVVLNKRAELEKDKNQNNKTETNKQLKPKLLRTRHKLMIAGGIGIFMLIGAVSFIQKTRRKNKEKKRRNKHTED